MVINLIAEQDRLKLQAKLQRIIRARPVKERADFIAAVFQTVVSEFAALMLEHIETEPPAKTGGAKPPGIDGSKPKAKATPKGGIRRSL